MSKEMVSDFAIQHAQCIRKFVFLLITRVFDSAKGCISSYVPHVLRLYLYAWFLLADYRKHDFCIKYFFLTNSYPELVQSGWRYTFNSIANHLNSIILSSPLSHQLPVLFQEGGKVLRSYLIDSGLLSTTDKVYNAICKLPHLSFCYA